MKRFLLSAALLLSVLFGYAQETDESKSIDFDVQLKNMHYWRGFAVTTAPLIASSLYYQSPNGLWKMGFWGGMGFNESYREFDYFVSFQKGGFFVSAWDIYNFSAPEISGEGYFDYSNRTTGHFIDLTVGYDFGEAFPLKLAASTIVHGRDSDMIDEEFLERSGRLRYTTYIEATYTVLKNEQAQLQIFVGGALALSGVEETFYANKNSINFAGLHYQRTITINDYAIPVQLTPAWNPNADHAYMEVAISLF